MFVLHYGRHVNIIYENVTFQAFKGGVLSVFCLASRLPVTLRDVYAIVRYST